MKSRVSLCLLLLVCHQALADRYVVTTTADAVATGDGCSLREAIESVNAAGSTSDCLTQPAAGTDRIEFAIPGSGPHTIVLGSELAQIDRPVFIDGLSQPGASCDGELAIAITDNLAPPEYIEHGLLIGPDADGSVVQGLSITGILGHSVPGSIPTLLTYYGTALRVLGAADVIIQCMHIGMSPNGLLADPVGYGIEVAGSLDGLRIGTNGDGIDDPLERNLLLSMDLTFWIDSPADGAIRVSGNWVALDRYGRAPNCMDPCDNDYVSNAGLQAFIFDGAVDALMGYDGQGSRLDEANVIRAEVALVASGPELALTASGNHFGVSPDGRTRFEPGIRSTSILLRTDDKVHFGVPQLFGDSEFTGNIVAQGSPGFSSLVDVYRVSSVNNNPTQIRNNLFLSQRTSSGSPSRGVRLRGNTGEHAIDLQGNQFLGFDVALELGQGNRATGSGNCIEGNGIGARGDAEHLFGSNWWGSDSGPSGDGSGSGDAASGVSFLPFLTAPPPSCNLAAMVRVGPRQIPALGPAGITIAILMVMLVAVATRRKL